MDIAIVRVNVGANLDLKVKTVISVFHCLVADMVHVHGHLNAIAMKDGEEFFVTNVSMKI